ncbi:type II secretion system F family protein [Streptomyces sp. NPDC059740]|uniref:type II secretion system F family protein n=1 Tax=Streptomyces sp. NPDC059740 TaxID=3346926 RepID=UPI003650D588
MAVGAFGTVVLVAGGLSGVVPGLATAGAARYLLRRERARAAALVQARREEAGLPAAADLLAACLASGACPRRAAEAVGDSLPGPVGDRLRTVAAELRLGAEPATAWSRLGSLPGATALARCLERATVTGAPAGEAVARAAEALREESRRAALSRSQRAGVLITAPLAVCFLPAFLTVGVVPVLVGLAGQLMATG